jgi:hypothetical protein
MGLWITPVLIRQWRRKMAPDSALHSAIREREGGTSARGH